MDILFLTLLFFGGILAGLYGSSVGSGGLVTFPLLILAGLPTHIAIATNRFGATFLELSSVLRYHRAKKLNLKRGLWFGLMAAIGGIIGAHIVIQINEKILNLFIAIVFLAVFLFLFTQNKTGLRQRKTTTRHLVLASLFTFGLGIYGGFFGMGFGTLIMFPFIVLGFNFIKSAATGRFIGFTMSLVSASVFAYYGLINYSYGISLAAGCALGAWLGAGLAIKKGHRFIKPLLVLIILITIGKLFFRFLNS